MTVSQGQSFGQSVKNSETIKLNGIELYYEVYGDGEPLFLLHGWTQSSQFWAEYISTFARHFKVYTIDLRGHGKTSQVTSDFSIEQSALDIIELLGHLKIKKLKAIGLSYGGLTLLELAKLNRELLDSIILIGTSPRYKGGEKNLDNLKFSFDKLPVSFVEELKEIHYQGENQIKALFDPNLNYQIKLQDEELKAFNFRTLIIQGDRDEILGIEPALALYENIPNSDLWIVPNTGHIAITGPNQKNFLEYSLRFLL